MQDVAMNTLCRSRSSVRGCHSFLRHVALWGSSHSTEPVEPYGAMCRPMRISTELRNRRESHLAQVSPPSF